MKRILFATDSYGDVSTANGICTSLIAKDFARRGYRVHIICFREGKETTLKEDGLLVHTLHPDLVSALANISKKSNHAIVKKYARMLSITINRAEAVLFLPWFPMRTPISCRKYSKRMKRLHEKYSFDAVVSSYRPFEATYAMYKLKQTSDVSACMYTLDTLSDFEKNHFLSKQFQMKKGFVWEKRFYDRFNLILNPKCHENNYNKKKYNRFKYKLKIIDFPHIVNRDGHKVNKSNIKHSEKKKKMIYAGALRGTIVNEMLKCLEELFENDEARLDVYGYNSQNSLNGYQNDKAVKNIKIKGAVDHENMLMIEDEADVLISIGNTGATRAFVPSKIFEYMSTGGKILHFCESMNDSCVVYYQKYSNAQIVDLSDGRIKNKRKIREFIDKKKENITYEMLKNEFPMNTPEFTADIIERELGLIGK